MRYQAPGASALEKNLVDDYGAVPDGAWAVEEFALSLSDPTRLRSPVPLWPPTVVGKAIVVGEAGSGPAGEPQGGTALRTTIAQRVSSTEIVLAAPATCALPGPVNTHDHRVLVCWGTDSTQAFEDFRTECAGQEGVALTIPAGVYIVQSGNFGGLWQGVKGLVVNGTAGETTIAGGTWQIGGGAQLIGDTFARTKKVTAGDDFVMLEMPGHAARFTVGQTVLMTGMSIQYAGYPTNHQLYEYRRVTATSPATGKVTLDRALENEYLTTWPNWNPASDKFDGGPATLYGYHLFHDFELEVNGITFCHHAQWGMYGGSVTLNNCAMEGIYGPYATMSESVTLNQCEGLLCNMELDKYNWDVTLKQCNWSGIAVQSSSSARNLTLDGTKIEFTLLGTPYNTVLKNGFEVGTLVPGAQYGWGNHIDASDGIVHNFGAVDTHESGMVIPGADPSGRGVNVDFTMVDGVITVPKALYSGQYTEMWASVGNNFFWFDRGIGLVGRAKVTGLTQDNDNTYIQTDWDQANGGFPPRDYYLGVLYLRCAPARSCTFRNVTGCADVESLSKCEANKPLYSRSVRDYDGSQSIGGYFQQWGRIERVKINVTRAYSGSFGGAVQATCQFTNSAIKESDFTDFQFNPAVDARVVGVREWTPETGWTGGQPGDVLPNPEFVWVCGNTRMLLTDITSEVADRPKFTIEIDTDPGIVVDDTVDPPDPEPEVPTVTITVVSKGTVNVIVTQP